MQSLITSLAAAACWSWVKKYKTEVSIVLGGACAMHAIFLAGAFRKVSTVDTESAGQLGDFVGGYIGTLFVLVSVVLLFRTLRQQSEAFQLQNFETHLFEMIKMHRDNVADLRVQRAQGRRIFVLMIREYREILRHVREVAESISVKLTREQLIELSYSCLFYGTGPNSTRMLRLSLKSFSSELIDAVEFRLDDPALKRKTSKLRKLGYRPFEGHQSRLGHYYRHLFQTIRFVHDQRIDIKKYDYVKLVRAQLSTHEQALLLLNSLTPLGKRWTEEGLLDEYRLVKNLPREFFDSGTEIDLAGRFKIGYFEWEKAYGA